MRIRSFGLALVTIVVALIALPGSGCRQQQMAGMTDARSKGPADVLSAAEAVLRERFYQVRQRSPEHLVALTPIEVVGNEELRKRIDVYVFLENGFYMPKVSVRNYLDVSEPPAEKGGPITRRFPIEVSTESPYPAENWQPLAYDRGQENEIRNAILARLQIPS